MAGSLEESKRVPLQPLNPHVREQVEEQYAKFHDAKYQYESPAVQVDGASRKAPSVFAETSSELSPVESVDIHTGICWIRVSERHRDSSSTVRGISIFLHGGKVCSLACVESDATAERINARTGAFVAGDHTSDGHIFSRICHDSDDVVVSVKYRLAPEDPYPAAVDDCFGVLKWVKSNCKARWNADPRRIKLIGLSAGANLAVVTGLNAGLANPLITLQAVIAIAAPCDMTATPESDTWKPNAYAPVTYAERRLQTTEHYVGKQGTAAFRGDEWRASPLLAPLEVLCKLPTTLLLVPKVDTYYGEQIELYNRLQKAKVDVSLKVYPRAVHPFMSMDKLLPSGKLGLEDLVNFVKEMNRQTLAGIPDTLENIGFWGEQARKLTSTSN